MWWTWGQRLSRAAGLYLPTENQNEDPASWPVWPRGSTAWMGAMILDWCLPPACLTIAFTLYCGRRMDRSKWGLQIQEFSGIYEPLPGEIHHVWTKAFCFNLLLPAPDTNMNTWKWKSRKRWNCHWLATRSTHALYLYRNLSLIHWSWTKTNFLRPRTCWRQLQK